MMDIESNAIRMDADQTSSSNLLNLNRQRRLNPEECDVLLFSSGGLCFPAHKEVLCEFSAFFTALFEANNFIEAQESKCQLKSIDSDTLEIILDFIYTSPQLHSVKIHKAFKVFCGAHFLGVPKLEKYARIQVERHPLDALFHNEDFLTIEPESVTYLNLILNGGNLLITEPEIVRSALIYWLDICSETRGKAFVELSRSVEMILPAEYEFALIFDGETNKCYKFYGNRWHLWNDPKSANLSCDVVHIALSPTQLFYTTPRAIFNVEGNERLETYKEGHDLPWPPLVRTFGKYVYITKNNRKQLFMRDLCGRSWMRCLDAEHSVIRHIATADCENYECVYFLVTYSGKYQVMFMRSPKETCPAIDLNCPFAYIEMMAVLRRKLYVIGSETGSAVPTSLLVYSPRTKCWQKLPSRMRDQVPKAFFPLSGKLFVVCNGLSTIEVFEPKVKEWTIDSSPTCTYVTGFCVSNETPSCLK